MTRVICFLLEFLLFLSKALATTGNTLHGNLTLVEILY